MFNPGELLHGRYRIDRVLGHGGMGQVYLATHMELAEPVAIKEMEIAATSDDHASGLLNLFRSEAKILANLLHPGLPRVHDFFAFEGKYLLVMDFIQGQTLETILSREGPIPEGRLLAWVRELCDVLEYLHTHEPPVIFRDLKPSNIMLDQNGKVRMIDFGIAKVTDPANQTTRTIIRGAGTPGFAPPEQYGAGTDARSDIYALGATMYFLLTRVPPPPSVEIASGGARLVPVREYAPNLSEATAHAVERMMEIGRPARPQSIEEVRQDLGFIPRELPPPTPSNPEISRLALSEPPSEETQPQVEVVPPPSPPQAFGTVEFRWVVAGILGVAMAALWLTRPVHRRTVASLAILSYPPGASVRIDNADRGRTPLKLSDLPAGTYVVHLEAPGADPITEDVNLSTGEERVFSRHLTVSPGRLTVSADRDGTEVRVDGVLKARVGPQPVTLDVPPGLHRIELQRDGFNDWGRDIALQPGQLLSLPAVALSSRFGSVQVDGTPGARVVVDGVVRGQVPLLVEGLKPGDHAVRLVAPGFIPRVDRVGVQAGGVAVVKIMLAPGRSGLFSTPVRMFPPRRPRIIRDRPGGPNL